MKQVLYDALCPPHGLVEGQGGVRGVTEGDVLTIDNLVAQVFPALIRGVEAQNQGDSPHDSQAHDSQDSEH